MERQILRLVLAVLDCVQQSQVQEFFTLAVAVALVEQVVLELAVVVLVFPAVVMVLHIILLALHQLLLTQAAGAVEAKTELQLKLLVMVALALSSFVTPHLYYHPLPQQEALR
jgi:hypothetical protein